MTRTHNLLARQLKKCFGASCVVPPEWQPLVEMVNSAYEEFDADRALLENSMELSSKELFDANSEMRAVFQALPDVVLRLDHEGQVLALNAGGDVDHQRFLSLVGKRFHEMLAEPATNQFQAALRQAVEQKVLATMNFTEMVQGQEVYYEARLVPLLETQVVAIIRNVTERNRQQAELEKTQNQLVEVSRHAGMAEVATAILHNVGNVLNSVNVSATLVTEKLARSKVGNVRRIAELIQKHRADLGEFIASDPKGRMLPEFLAELGNRLEHERASVLEELGQLTAHIEQIKQIVTMQQSLANASGVVELVWPTELMDDAMRMNVSALTNVELSVARDYRPDEMPRILLDRHKVLRILVSLISNAAFALEAGGQGTKRLDLRVVASRNSVQFSVTDNGIGIPQENLARIFRHGFTTREGGHGFGLHAGALAAKEMGGTLLAQSDGPGKGATFTLELPIPDRASSARAPMAAGKILKTPEPV